MKKPWDGPGPVAKSGLNFIDGGQVIEARAGWLLVHRLASSARFSLALGASAAAQQPAPAAPGSARATAPLDLTGVWVSVVTEDWRWRMTTPAQGDVLGIPVNPQGQKAADAWDYARDMAAGNQCKAYGAGGIMRMPTRLRIGWQDDNTLKVETDAGQQTQAPALRSHGSRRPAHAAGSFGGRVGGCLRSPRRRPRGCGGGPAAARRRRTAPAPCGW